LAGPRLCQKSMTCTLLFWINTVCINQSDVQERNIQVGLMGSIYSFAQHTILYLRPGTIESDIGFQAIRPSKVEFSQSWLPDAVWQLAEQHVLNRSWFSRVWILQELVLSRDPWIQCGRFQIRWDEFYSRLEKYSRNLGSETTLSSVDPNQQIHCHNQPPFRQRGENGTQKGTRVGRKDYYGGLKDMQKMRQGFQLYVYGGLLQGGVPSLLEVLVARRCFGVTDPRDMVFAHLGFVDTTLSSTENQTALVQIEYRKSVAEVYTDAARLSIRRSGNLLVLSQTGNINPSLRRSDLPPWVPDWMSPFSGRPYTKKFRDPRDSERFKYDEPGLWTKKHPGHNIWPQDTSALIFDGYSLDIIKDVSPVIPYFDDVARRKALNWSINWGVPMAVYIGARKAPKSGDFGGQGGTPALRQMNMLIES